MAGNVKIRLRHRVALAYHRTQDRVLAKRGRQFRGTPAKRFEDIRNYFTHAAIHRLEDLLPPKALGRPGISDHAWFASRQSAGAIGRRHGGYRSAKLFDVIMKDTPLDAVLAPSCLVTMGCVGDPSRFSQHYAVYAVALTVAARNRYCRREEDAQDQSPAAVVTEHRLFAIVRLAEDIVGAAIFQRDAGSDLYRLALIGMRPPREDRLHDCRRLEHLAFKRFNAAIRRWPGVSFDFIGAAEPEAAAMGYSLFRYLRKIEMVRLQALGPKEYDAERRRVTSYRYPVFSRDEVVTPSATIRAMLTEAPRWALCRCLLTHRRLRYRHGGTP